MLKLSRTIINQPRLILEPQPDSYKMLKKISFVKIGIVLYSH